ncbi:MAG TPA: alpha/beta fold hydrolase [Candidatus Polarisedimenticolaceae bacterium]|nr:alpha/beta fold hydrolase [Candidatus Polarisedimenticolaceae bacterium]
MTLRSFVFALAVCSIAVPFASAAATPAPAKPAAPAPEVFELLMKGTAIGTEEARRVAGGEQQTLTSTLTVTPPGGGEGKLTQSALLAKDGRLKSYELSLDAQGQQLVFKAAPAGDKFTLSVTPLGAAEPAKSETIDAKGPTYLLDNNFGSHLDVLTRSLEGLGADQEKAITAVVPQALQAFPATVHRGPDGSGKLAGKTVATRSYALTIANVREELIARASDGALLQATVAIQNFVLRRKGYEPAAAAAAATARPAGETETTVKSAAGALPAVLTVPKSEKPVAGIVFLSGSGAHDGDETIGPNKPFQDIARGLASRGIASLRFDKRTFAVRDPAKLGTIQLKEEYYDDAQVALAQLRATPGVDPKRVFVLGHSEGASVAPHVAAIDPAVRGVVMLAPAVRPIDELVIDQTRYGAKLTGRTDEEIDATVADLRERFTAIRDASKTDTPAFMGAPPAYWREVMALDVPAMVQSVKVPVLVLQGDADIQVRKDLDFGALQQKVGTDGGRVTYRSFPGLNHLFMKVQKESTGAEYGIPGNVDPAVIQAIADWVLAH